MSQKHALHWGGIRQDAVFGSPRLTRCVWTVSTITFLCLALPALAAPPVPTQPVPVCDATVNGKCYVDGAFNISTTSQGAHHFRLCRSNDTTGWGGCNQVISFNTGATVNINGSHLPSDGFRRAFYFSACDNNNDCTPWGANPEAYVQMDLTGPTAPGASTVSCSSGTCWVQGNFTVSVTPASDSGSGVGNYQFCRSNDSPGGFAGCQAVMGLVGSTSFLVSGSNLPSDGFRRAYWVRGRDNVGNFGAWNSPRYVRVDRYNPTVSANNASNQWFTSRTATVSAADATNGAAANSGLETVRYRWNNPLNAACSNGTVTANGGVLTVPVGDNHLYLCAKDVSGRIGTWNGGPYRVSSPCPIADDVEPKACESQAAAIAAVARQKAGIAPLSDFEVHEALYEAFVDYELATIDPAALRRAVDSAEKVQLSIAGDAHELVLEPVEVRAPSYVATEVGDEGEIELPRQPSSTYRGRVADVADSDVRLFISPQLVMGYVELEGRRFFIDPAYRYAEGGGANRLVIYEEGDQRDEEGVSCGLSEMQQHAEHFLGDSQGLAEASPFGGTTFDILETEKGGTLREMEVATDADFEYYAIHGGNTNSHILSVINMVNGFYDEVGLELRVVNQRVFTSASADPYETCNVFGQWCEMWSEWNENRTSIHRDLAHLFSGKRLYQSATRRVRGTSGLAGTVCNPSEAFSTSTPYREAGLVAHEMGHALNAQHINNSFCPDRDCLLDCDPDDPNDPCNVDTCPDPDPAGGPVMCGSIQQPVTDFTGSVTTITNYINGAGSCLSPINNGTPVEPWQDNANGSQVLNISWNYAMGYHFTPQTSGQVTALGGFFNGNKTVKLFNKTTGALLAQANVSAANTWGYTNITPVNVQAGTTYTVAVYLAGSGGSYRTGIQEFPRTYGDIRIEGSTFIHTGTNANARPTNNVTIRMYGQADIRFVGQ